MSKSAFNTALYRQRNHVWDRIALDYPLIHKQSGIKVHLVGTHHHSALSLERVTNTINQLKPGIVCLELDQERIDSVHERLKAARKTHQMPDNVRAISQSSFMKNSDLSFTDSAFYALEASVGLELAQQMKSCVKLIDCNTNLIIRMDVDGHKTPYSESVSQARDFFKLPKLTSIGTPSLLAKAIRAFALQFLLPGVEQRMADDWAEYHEMERFMNLQRLVNPSEYHFQVFMRDAYMTFQLHELVRQLHQGAILENNLDHKTIVAVIGKAHIFGIHRLWNAFVADRRLSGAKKPIVIKSDPLPQQEEITEIPVISRPAKSFVYAE